MTTLTKEQKENLGQILNRKHDLHPVVCLHALDQNLTDQFCAIIIELCRLLDEAHIPFMTNDAQVLVEASYQQRVIQEKNELDSKRSKLSMFIGGVRFPNLTEREKSLLRQQLHIMGEYSECLSDRIKLFV